MQTTANEYHGLHHLTVALRLALLGWLAMTLQEILLFVRPTPYGGRYAESLEKYFFHALAYNILGVMLVSAPFLLGWLLRRRRKVHPRVAVTLHYVQLGVLMLTVVLDHIDNEVMRFMGRHLTYGLVETYYKVNAWGSDMAHIFTSDRGGPLLPYVILVVVPVALWWAGRRVIRQGRALPFLWFWPRAAAACLLPLIIPYLMHGWHGAGWRQRRVQPAIMTLYTELDDNMTMGTRPDRFEALAGEYQARWFQNSADTAWRFTDPERPLVRVPLTPAPPVQGERWNVIYIQLETFRAWNTGFLRPDEPESATPFLDRIARDTASGFWQRHLSMGMPTVNGLISGLCSVKPHSHYYVASHFTYSALECLPSTLRRHGYAAEHFTGSDPDWDGEKFWLQAWYDRYHYYEESGHNDRFVFRKAAERIRELGRGPRPFLAVITTISNHYPFRSREPQFTLDPTDQPDRAIRNTMRYTDDAMREFFQALQREPWFGRTLFVITGDHGYNLGEHGYGGYHSGWRETVWVPLVIHGAHPRLPRGGHMDVASLLDVTPTIADLLAIREPNPWMGSSLAAGGKASRSFTLIHLTATYGDQGRFSMVVDPSTGGTLLYDALEDPLQRNNIAGAHPDVADRLRRQAEDERQLVNFLLEANLVWKTSERDRAKEHPRTVSR